MATYTSQYPTAQNDTYVKSTTKFSTSYWAYYATDPTKSLVDSWTNNQWVSANGSGTNQRFHIDLGSSKIIRRIYYENSHTSGSDTDRGAKDFTLWGSNDADSFAELAYGTDTGWTQLTTAQSTLDQHASANALDPKYILITNAIPYRYYAFKFATAWASVTYMGVRRIELQTEDGFYGGGQVIIWSS
jgi:hypothetical protein